MLVFALVHESKVLYKIIRIVRALSLVKGCIEIKVCKHGCDITRILTGYVFRCAFWLAGKNYKRARIKKIYFDKEVNKQHLPSSVELFSRTILQTVMHTLDCVSGLHNFSNSPR